MACDNAPLSFLLKKGDTITIVVLVGAGVGGFLLGVLVPTLLCISRRPSASSLVDSKIDTYSYSTTQKISDGVYDGVPFSPGSLSQTFARHNLKPPTNKSDSREKTERNSLQHMTSRDRRDGDHPFKSVGHESLSSLASDAIPRFERIEFVGGHHVNVYSTRLSDARSQRNLTGRPSFSRSIVESTIHETGSMPDLSASVTGIMGGTTETLGYPSQGTAKPEQNRIQRAKSDPRIAHSGGEKTGYKLSAHEFRRMRTFSSQERDSESCGESSASATTATGMTRSKRVRRPPITSTQPSEAAVNSSSSSLQDNALTKEQEPDLTRHASQRAAAFYQEHANRHLSLPNGGPLSSAVLPESPSGVIGNSDEGAKRDFSFA